MDPDHGPLFSGKATVQELRDAGVRGAKMSVPGRRRATTEARRTRGTARIRWHRRPATGGWRRAGAADAMAAVGFARASKRPGPVAVVRGGGHRVGLALDRRRGRNRHTTAAAMAGRPRRSQAARRGEPWAAGAPCGATRLNHEGAGPGPGQRRLGLVSTTGVAGFTLVRRDRRLTCARPGWLAEQPDRPPPSIGHGRRAARRSHLRAREHASCCGGSCRGRRQALRDRQHGSKYGLAPAGGRWDPNGGPGLLPGAPPPRADLLGRVPGLGRGTRPTTITALVQPDRRAARRAG
jgi:hypothetical protein